ncbi:hypothetical protein [Nostocoides japonicum]|nr:hypothetical protein [Tetrasphaera japonica]
MTGLVIGVLGASGGVGTSTAAAHLAWRAARGSTVLVDAHPATGALDVHVGIEHLPGPRWSAFQRLRGETDGAAVVSALPRTGRYAVLAGDGRPPPPAVLESVLCGLRDVADLLVLDLGAGLPSGRVAVTHCAAVVVVAGLGVRRLADLDQVAADLHRTPEAPAVRSDAAGAPRRGVISSGVPGEVGGGTRAPDGVPEPSRAPGGGRDSSPAPGEGPERPGSPGRSSMSIQVPGAGLPPPGAAAYLVTRGPARCAGLADEVATHVGLPLLTHWADEARVGADLEHGVPPGERAHGLDRGVDLLMAALPPPRAVATA